MEDMEQYEYDFFGSLKEMEEKRLAMLDASKLLTLIEDDTNDK